LFPQHPQQRKVNWQEVCVESVTLDTLFAGEQVPDLVKIDVEGSEHRVLRGAQNLLEGRKTRFLVEVHPWQDPATGRGPSDVFELFAQFGYDYVRIYHHFLFQPSPSRVLARLKSLPPRLIFRYQSLLSPAKTVVRYLSRQ
jgi:hypothetical protein